MIILPHDSFFTLIHRCPTSIQELRIKNRHLSTQKEEFYYRDKIPCNLRGSIPDTPHGDRYLHGRKRHINRRILFHIIRFFNITEHLCLSRSEVAFPLCYHTDNYLIISITGSKPASKPASNFKDRTQFKF